MSLHRSTSGVPALPVDPNAVKAGPQTTEFWVTVLGVVAAVLAQIFHKDLTAYVPQVATAAAGLVALGYQFSRGLAKKRPAVHYSAAAPDAPVVNVTAPAPAATGQVVIPQGPQLNADPLPPLDATL